LEPFQEQSGEQHNEGAEVCNSAESIVDDLMELAIETPEKKTKDTTSGEAPQMLHLSPARVKRSEKKIRDSSKEQVERANIMHAAVLFQSLVEPPRQSVVVGYVVHSACEALSPHWTLQQLSTLGCFVLAAGECALH
jgi:hypothetical protein